MTVVPLKYPLPDVDSNWLSPIQPTYLKSILPRQPMVSSKITATRTLNLLLCHWRKTLLLVVIGLPLLAATFLRLDPYTTQSKLQWPSKRLIGSMKSALIFSDVGLAANTLIPHILKNIPWNVSVIPISNGITRSFSVCLTAQPSSLPILSRLLSTNVPANILSCGRATIVLLTAVRYSARIEQFWILWTNALARMVILGVKLACHVFKIPQHYGKRALNRLLALL